MLLSLNMPTWLVDFWTIYGDMITPILVTLLTSIVTYLAVKIKSDAKLNNAKTDLQIEALKEVASKEDCSGEISEQTKEVKELKNVVNLLADMFNVAFQNANLDPEIKNNLSALVNKIKYGTEEDLVKELEENNAKLKEEIESLTQQLVNNAAEVVKEEVVKRVRR